MICISVAVLMSSVAFAQNISVSGNVTDSSNGEPIPFASVHLDGTTIGVSTDSEGHYSLSVPHDGMLVFSSIGYQAKEILAYELTKLVHGEEEATKAQAAAKAIFSGAADLDNMPSTTLSDADFADGKIDILDILMKAEITKSRGEGRRLVQQGGISVDDAKVTDFAMTFAQADLKEKPIVVKKGKKIFHKIEA